MWKCVGLMLFIGQWIIVTSDPVTNEDEISRYARKAGDCCPCPESTSRHSDIEHSASENVNVMTCPCNSRNSDSDTAPSILSPSTVQSFTRQSEQNGESKPILEPEGDLAPSMLETVREDTEEEHQEAISRDAGRSVIQSVDRNALIDDEVSQANARENIDMDTVPEASNNQERRCVSPSSDDYRLTNRDSLSSVLDMNYAPSNLYNNLHLPEELTFPVTPVQELSFSPSDIQNRFLPLNGLNPFARRAGLPALYTRPLLTAQSPIDLNNLLNLRNVELVPPRRVAIAREPEEPEEISYNIMNNRNFEPATDSSINVVNKTPKISNTNDNFDCGPHGSESSIPNHSGNSLRMTDHSTDQNRNIFNILTSPNQSNKEKYVSPDISIRDNVLKTLEDFRQANTMMHDNLRSSLDNVLKPENREPSNYFKEDRSSNSFKTIASMEDLHDKMLFNNHEVIKTMDKSNNNLNNMNINQKKWVNDEENMRTPTKFDDRNGDFERDSSNLETCVIHDRSNKSPQHFYTQNNEMRTAASEPNYAHQYSHDIKNFRNSFSNVMSNDPLEDIDLDIFQYQPALHGINGLKNLRLPQLNMKSYKAQLHVPNSLNLKPVKLQKTLRRGSDILGATLSMKPHKTKKAFGLLNKNMRSSQNEPRSFGIPNIEDIRSYLENSAPNILNLPFMNLGSHDECGSGNILGSANENLRSFAENAIANVQDTLDNTFREGNIRDNPLIGDTILNPSDVIETITEAREDANDKLRNFQLDLNDRLQRIHQSLISQSRIPSPSILQHRESKPYTSRLEQGKIKYNPNKMLSNSKDNKYASTFRSVTTSQNSPTFSSISSTSPISRRTSTKSLSANKGNNFAQLGQKLDSKRPLSLHERLNLAKESKDIISFTTKKPPIRESLQKIKPLSARNPTTALKKENQPAQSRRVSPQMRASPRKQIGREPKTSPSEVIYTKIPSTSRMSPKESLCEENNEQTLGESLQVKSSRPAVEPRPRSSGRNSILPNIAENTFLSKVKEAVAPKHLERAVSRNSNNDTPSNYDIALSASEIKGKSIEPSTDISFNCKMVCSKS
ncbi:uncharacterized protein LOC123700407 [Colias croceus]|uniref:uncharacterized protein LOC123700407 n=1 Tax=Colias crocea TaxID=72248 RepID=UPI001E27B875|nr:uncharacterized protein LOC123700407 [Colias croceus]